MPRLRTLLFALFLLLVLCWLAATWILKAVTSHAIEYSPLIGRELGLEIEAPQAELSRVVGVRSVAWEGLSASLRVVSANSIVHPGARYFFTADYLGASLLASGKVLLELEGVRLDPIPEEVSEMKPEHTKLKEEHVHGRILLREIRFVVDLSSYFAPKREVQHLLDELRRLLTEGITQLGMTVQGDVQYRLDERPFAASIVTDTNEGFWVFRIARSELLEVHHLFEPLLGDAEIELLRAFPFRLPFILSNRYQLFQTASNNERLSDEAMQSAYFDVLLSYRLARRYGQEFARRYMEVLVQDAEVAQAVEVVRYSNQRAGRELANEELSEDELLERVLTSEEVIRQLIEVEVPAEATAP